LLFIPPQSVVRKKLQYISAYKGLEDDSLYEYALAFFKFIKRNVRKDYQHLLKPVKKMLDDRKTQSDYIIKKAKKMGYTDEIPDDAAKELAVHFSGKLENDLEKTKKALQRIQ